MGEQAKDRLGKAGETHAARYLKRRGLKLVERNYHAAGAEIDLIATDRGTLVFVEVKTRKTDRWGPPGEAVNTAKRRHIVRAARQYIAVRRVGHLPCRFDVVEVVMTDGKPQINHIADAFTAES